LLTSDFRLSNDEEDSGALTDKGSGKSEFGLGLFKAKWRGSVKETFSFQPHVE
jgi:hypothetical protein